MGRHDELLAQPDQRTDSCANDQSSVLPGIGHHGLGRVVI